MKCKIMQSVMLAALFMFAAGTAKAQWLTSDIYDQPLQQVLDQIKQRYGVQLVYEERHVRDRIVLRAPWRFYSEVEATLDNVLRPLDMIWERRSDGVFEIRRWNYFLRPPAEGAAHLEQLLVAYPDLETWEARRANLRAHIMETKGLVGLKKSPLNPIISAKREHDGYTVQNIALEVLPGVWVSGSLYKPANYSSVIPVFLSPHGHFNNNDLNLRGRFRPDQQFRCAMLARMGVAVFSYDNFGWSESALAFTMQDHRTDLGLVMQTWHGIRILDYLLEQPWADATRVGITGGSGGGSQAMFMAALDDRVTLSVPAVMISSYHFGGCPCESGLPIHFPEKGLPSNNVEIAAMAAPRPQLILSVGTDWTAHTPEIEFPYLRQIYGFFGKADEVENVHFPEAPHSYGFIKREALYDFVARKFGLDPSVVQDAAGAWDESRVTIEPAEAMLVFPDGVLPPHAVKGGDNLRELLRTHRLGEGTYSLTVNGQAVEVVPFKHYFYALVELTEAADMSLTSGTAIETYEISPLSRNIQSVREGNTVHFRMDKPQYVMVRINETERIFIFVEPPEVIPTENVVSILSFGISNDGTTNVTEQVQRAINQTAANRQTLLFPPGIYKTGQLVLPSYTHLHLSRGAELLADDTSIDVFRPTGARRLTTRGFLFILDASNVKITGLGAINANGARLRELFGNDGRVRVLLAVNSTNIVVNGVMLKDPGSWNTQILMCRDVEFRNVKLLNDIDLSNTDGFNPDASQNVLFADGFIYGSDDPIAIKITGSGGYVADVENITIRGNVFLTKKSALKVGTESRGENMRNILFEDNDVLESDRGMALYVLDGAHYDNIRFINNRFERNHPDLQQQGIQFRAVRRNPDSRLGKMTNILIKDATFYRAFPRRSEIRALGPDIGIEVTIENLVIEGRRVTSVEEAGIVPTNATVIFR